MKVTKKIIAALLALLILVEPSLITVARANDLPQPRISEERIDSLPDTDELVAPADYLEYMLKLRGKTKSEVEARVWGEWMMTLNSAYMLMDDGSTDVFGFYEALKIVRENSTILADISDVVKTISRTATLSFAFLFRTRALEHTDNLILGFMRLTNMAQKAQDWVENNRVLNFMEFAAPPPCWNNPEVAGQGFKSYWRWVRGKNTGAADAVGELSKAQGIARSIGIGLTIFGLAVSAFGIYRSEDRQGGRLNSFSLVKHYAYGTLGLATLVAMFCVPIVGQIVMVAGILWAVTEIVGDIVGQYNKRWKDAYKNSYYYLYENDPEFKSFYNNRKSLKTEEKAVSLQLIEADFADFYAQAPKEGKDTDARNSRVYIALEKQGVLVSYYAQKGFTLPDFGLDRLQELWNMKADYMSWKPTEAEAEADRNSGFWGKVGKYVNPLTYVSWAGDKIKSADYKELIKEYNIQKVFFNPDYVLLKKFQNYVTARNLRGGIFDLVGLRIEQSPFNYIPLVGIDSSAWSKELLSESFAADGFIVGQKELVFFREQVKAAAEKAKTFIDGLDETVEKIVEKDLPQTEKIRTFLDQFLIAYNADSERENDRLFKDGKRIFGWRWSREDGAKSPKNILEKFKNNFEQSLFAEPISLGQKAAETVVLLTTVKQQLDMAKLMRKMSEEKAKALAEFDKTFKNHDIRKFLQKGSFLDVEGKTVMDWFSQIYPPVEEMQKYLNLFNDDIEDYTGIADEGNSSTRERMFWFDKEITHPSELLRKLNFELGAWKETLDGFAEISDEANLKLILVENEEFAEKVFAEFGLEYEIQALDPETPVEAPSES